VPTIDHRTATIAGLHALAAFLEANPAVPVPRHSIRVTYFAQSGDDDPMRAEIDHIADLLGAGIDTKYLAYGHHVTGIGFGPVRYEAAAILSDARARQDALNSYSGCVTPEPCSPATDPAQAA
jgi:hypothetical protein